MRPTPSAAVALSAVSLLGAAVASAVTLAWDGAFPPYGPDANTVLAEARGWSAVTLALAVPLGAWALVARDTLRGRLWLAGTLAYLLYTYLEMATAPPFTVLYLVYVATFATALPALVAVVATVDPAALAAALDDRGPRRAIVAFSLVVPLGLAAAWLNDIVTRLLAGGPAWPDALGAVRHVVEALDLGLQVPLGLATAALLLGRRPAGWLLAALQLVMGVLMGAALTGMVGVSGVVTGQGPLGAAPFAGLFLVAALIAAAYFREARQLDRPEARAA